MIKYDLLHGLKWSSLVGEAVLIFIRGFERQ